MNPMTAVVPGPGLPPSGTPTISSPAPTTAEPGSDASEQLSSAGGDGPSHPSGIPAITAHAHFDGDGTDDDAGHCGVPQILAELGTVALA
jgi:hypothetical protein